MEQAKTAPATASSKAAAAEQQQQNIAAVSVTARIPDFWPDQPRVWFIQAEAVTQPQHLSDEAKYHLIITKLGKDVITQVTDILIKPPENNKYKTLKDRLLHLYEESETRQIQKLIGELDLGDRKPSRLLRQMQDLARDKVNDNTLTILWQNHLPPSVRAVLVSADTKDLATMARIADRVMESVRPVQVDAVSQLPDTNAQLVAEIAKLNLRMERMEQKRSRSYERRAPHRQDSRDRSASRYRPQWRAMSPADNGLCFYHQRFRNRAHKCMPPCTWKVATGNDERRS